MEKLLQLLHSIESLSAPLQAHLKKILKRNVFKKRSYLLQAGQVSDCIHFIETGMVRCFYDKEAQEINIWFMDAGNVIISVESFLRQIKSYQYIQAMEECITWSVSYARTQRRLPKFPEFNFTVPFCLKNIMSKVKRRQRILSLNTAVERYALLMETQPEITLQLPAKYIASYLNIDEGYFSKIKSRYAG